MHEPYIDIHTGLIVCACGWRAPDVGQTFYDQMNNAYREHVAASVPPNPRQEGP